MYLCNYTSSKSTREARDWPSRKKSTPLFLQSNLMFFGVLTRQFCQIYFWQGRRMAPEIHKVLSSKNWREAAAWDRSGFGAG